VTIVSVFLTNENALLVSSMRIILRWIFRKLEGVLGTGWSWLRIGTGGGRALVGTVRDFRVS